MQSPGPTVDLLIVGGGINGVGIARDAAGRGLNVLMVEKGDLAEHTSSASTKLIHGGLRYLEYFELRLVREALLERERLLGIAPHLIRPMEFVLPCIPGLRSKWVLRTGLFIYDHIGGRISLPATRAVKLHRSAYGAGLKSNISDAFVYADCWVDDSRLVVLNALDAHERGAQIRTRTRLVEARREQSAWRAVLENVKSGAREVVRSRILVNAAGPWVSDVLRDVIRLSNPLRARLVKGSHIVLPKLYDGSYAMMLQNADRRIVFTIPYEQHFTLVGTTEIPWNEPPGAVEITEDETRYLCDTVNRYFARSVGPGDVRWSYSGVRPLFDDAAKHASAVTRDYVLDIDAPDGAAPLLSVFGGKITTYRRLAEHALQKLGRWQVPQKTWTHDVPLPGGEIAPGEIEVRAYELQQQYSYLSAVTTRRLFRAYGTRAGSVLGHARSLPELGEHFGAGLYRAEVDYLVRHEWARTPQDILFRRSKLGLHAPEEAALQLASYLKT